MQRFLILKNFFGHEMPSFDRLFVAVCWAKYIIIVFNVNVEEKK